VRCRVRAIVVLKKGSLGRAVAFFEGAGMSRLLHLLEKTRRRPAEFGVKLPKSYQKARRYHV
jgi:hypothetical protein